MIKNISSKENTHFKRWKSLSDKKGIKKHRQYLASGTKLIKEMLPLATAEFELLISHPDDAPSDFPGNVYVLSSELYTQLDEFKTCSPLIIGPLPELPIWQESSSQPGLRLICPLGDPANVGALIRTAVALNCGEIILTQESAHPFLPKALRSSSGTVLNAPLSMGPSLKELIAKNLAPAYALDLSGEDLKDFKWPASSYLFIGEEGQGLPTNSLQKITISINPEVESLNAVVAASLAIWGYNLSKKS